MKSGKFKREAIPQHKEVLNGLFSPKTIKKNKTTILNQVVIKEIEKEINEYLSRSNSQE